MMASDACSPANEVSAQEGTLLPVSVSSRTLSPCGMRCGAVLSPGQAYACPAARAVYRAYHRACGERGLTRLSERTFDRRLTRRRGTLQTTKRYGTRAAYAETL
jgi:hypothetical protein